MSRERTERWRLPLQRSRRAVEATLRLVEASERLADQAERLIARRLRSRQAYERLRHAWNGLTLAGRRLCRSGRCVQQSFDLVAAAPEQAGAAPLLLTYALVGSLDASLRLATTANRVEAISELFRSVTVPVPGGGLLAAQQRRRLPLRLPSGDLRFGHDQHTASPSASYADGFRRISRGRAPPER